MTRQWSEDVVQDGAGPFEQGQVDGHVDGSVAIVRTGKGHSGEAYVSDFKRVELSAIAAKTRKMPSEFIKGHNDVSDAFLNYCRPLVGELPTFERF